MDGLISESNSCVPKTWTLYRVWGINAWDKWAKVANQERELGEPPIPNANNLELVSPKELDHYLKDFVNNMRRADGTVFKKASAHNIFRGLAAHLVEFLKCPHLNFMDHDDNNFTEFRKAAYRTTKILRRRKRIQDPSDETDHGNCLWDKHFDDLDTPEGLLHAVYAFNTFVFGVESIESHNSLLAYQFCLGSDNEGDFIKFYGNLKETRMSEETNPIFSVEEMKLYNTGECDSVYNIYKKYLNSIQANGKFYVLPCATKARKEKKMKGFSSTAMNSSQIQDLQEHLVSSRSYRKLHLLKDSDIEKRRFNIHPSYLSKLTHTSLTSTGAEDISLKLGKILSLYRRENCAEGLLSEENENIILKAMCNVTQKADTTQFSASNQVQQELCEKPKSASFHSLGRDPNLLATIPNPMTGKPNMMKHTAHSMTCTTNMMTHTPNMMPSTQNMMTGIRLGRGMPNHHCKHSQHPLSIQTSAEKSWFENRVTLDDQTLLLRTNIDKPKNLIEDNRLSIHHMENYLKHSDNTTLSQQFQQGFIQKQRRDITTGCYKDIAGVLSSQPGVEYLYQNTNDITSKYTKPHLRSQNPQCHLTGETDTSMSGTAQTFHTAPFPENFPQTSAILNSSAYQPQSLLMDNASSVHPKHQPYSNTSDIYQSPPKLSHHLFKQYRTMTPILSKATVSNHCLPLNYESLYVSHEKFSPLSGMTQDKLHNHNLRRQKLYGRGQQTSPLSILPPQKEMSVRESLDDHLYQGLQKIHSSEQNSQKMPTMLKSVQKRCALAQSFETQSNIKRSKGGIPENTEEGIDGQKDKNKRTTVSAQTVTVPLTGYAPMSETLEDIVVSPGVTDQNDGSVDNGTTELEDTNPGEMTKQKRANLHTDKWGQDIELRKINLSTKNSNPDSNSLDQNIKELLDFDPLLRESFHKKCRDWWTRHKSRFEMNNLLPSNSKKGNLSTESNKDDETSENTFHENLNQNDDKQPGNRTTANIRESKIGHTTMSKTDINSNSMYDGLSFDIPNQIDLRVNIGSVRVTDLTEQNTEDSQEIKSSEDGSEVICVADDVKCMSELYVD